MTFFSAEIDGSDLHPKCCLLFVSLLTSFVLVALVCLHFCCSSFFNVFLSMVTAIIIDFLVICGDFLLGILATDNGDCVLPFFVDLISFIYPCQQPFSMLFFLSLFPRDLSFFYCSFPSLTCSFASYALMTSFTHFQLLQTFINLG